ncbi:MAG: DUF5654 family protein [Thermoplasmata archaeon]|nr:DUF5654 family protein [Thermoplasmata archaeon]
MAETAKEISVAEVRRTVATALAAAFGFVIALFWRDAVVGILEVAGITLEAGADLGSVVYFILTGVLVTVIMVIAIVVVSRWSGSE